MVCKTVGQTDGRRQGEAAWSPGGVDEEEEAGELGRREDQHNVSVASLAFNLLTHLGLTQLLNGGRVATPQSYRRGASWKGARQLKRCVS